MAKKTPKETSLPLVFALVFFVLTTIAFGVMWYMQFSDQQAKDDAVNKAKKEVAAATGEAADAVMQARIYRIYLGIDQEKDKESVASETKAGAKIAAEVKKINEAAAKSVGVEDESKLAPDLRWPLDDKGMAAEPPAKGVLPIIGDNIKKRMAAEVASAKAVTDYGAEIAKIKTAVDDVEKLKKDFQAVAAALPKDFDTKFKAEVIKFDERKKSFTAAETKSRADITTLEDEKGKIEREKNKLKESVTKLQDEIVKIVAANVQKEDAFQFDEPQGKVLRRLPDGVVEINLGSAALVRQGLTFTVLPNDFPEKGRRSRVQSVRVRNERGDYKSVERFVEKATIEVTEVLGPNLSRCRITAEADPIRDDAAPGDLLYNSVWRKGTSDHVALVGIFDINGDGSDDIEMVVRDLTKMGIPVDAYFDLKTRKWKGAITEQTRYIIEGAYPVNSATDPAQEDKTKLISNMTDAVNFGRAKGVKPVNYRDFFPRMGYRVKVEITAEKINQATAPYLKRVAAIDTPQPQ